MLGPYLQGVLFEKIASPYASILHKLPFNPYSQFCFLDKQSGQLVWQISTLTEQAAEQIIRPVQDVGSITIKSQGIKLLVARTSLKTTTLKELTSLIHGSNQTRQSIQIITPVSFKCAGHYVHTPNLRLLFQNLLMRYGQVYDGNNEIEPQTVEYIDEHAWISSYNLRSSYFENISSSGVKIPAFIGSMTINVKGPQALTGLVCMLLRFAEYAGIGIKTAMGMGGMICLENRKPQETVSVSAGTEGIVG
jgi:CRISPR-associated endoribonuclease Cas6